MNPPDPAVSARHLPTPTHRWTAFVKLPLSWENEKPVPAVMLTAAGRRRSASSGSGSTMMPGFNRFCGSKSALTSSSARIASSECWRLSSSERARPSPCSPEADPPYRATSLPASRRKLRKISVPFGWSKGKSVRMWTHPSPKWPYGSPTTP